MEIEYKRDLNYNYLVLFPNEGLDIEQYQVKMVLKNQLRGFLGCKMYTVDGITKFYYEITSKQPLRVVYEKKSLGCRELRLLLSELKKALESITEFLLDMNDLVLDLNCIYLDVESFKVFFCYLPSYQISIQESFHQLAEYLLNILNHEDEEAVRIGYDIYRKSLEDNYSLEEIIQLIFTEQLKEERFEKEGRIEYQENQIKLKKEERNERCEEKKRAIKVNENCIDSHAGELVGGIKDYITSERGGFSSIIENKSRKILSIKWREKHIISLIGAFVLLVLLLILISVARMKFLEGWKLTDMIIKGLNIKKIGGVVFAIAGLFLYFLMKKRLKRGERQMCFKEEDCIDNRYHIEEPFHISQKIENPENCSFAAKEVDEAKESEYGMTTVLRYDNNTREVQKKLISVEPNRYPDIILNQKVIRIGKMPAMADVIIDSPMMSRLHAKIEQVGDEFYLTDLNSTNGTFVNGELFYGNQKYKLQELDEIIFADALYHFT
jgi:hypothetical protein